MTKTEAQTRKQIIDKKLLQAGWTVNDRTQVIEELVVPTKQCRSIIPMSYIPYFWQQVMQNQVVTKQSMVIFQNLHRFAGTTDPPGKIMEKLIQLEAEISNGFLELKQMGIN